MRRGLVLVLCSLLALALAAIATAAAAPRTPAPRTVGLTLDGKRSALSDLRGKPVIINVWSSW